MRHVPSTLPREIELETGPERALELDLPAASHRAPAASIAAAAPFAPPPFAPPPPPPPTTEAFHATRTVATFAPSRWDRFTDTFAAIDLGIWKRLATYPLLVLALGNGCTCRGLSTRLNALLAVLVVASLFGVYASLRDQRSW